jgi:hypothetical protein
MSTASQDKRLEWKEKIRLQKESGLSAFKWCREQNIKYKTLLYWRRQLGFAANTTIERSSFTELADASDRTGITIEYQQVRIYLTKNFDPAVLTKCLRTLKAGKC